MKELVRDFAIQLQEALIIGQNYRFNTEKKSFSNIVLTGLGGSGIGGSVVQNFVADKMKIPFIVNKDYTLPAFISKDTLVIASSYSGNTEETVACLQQAIKAKATVICITSGGKLSEIAEKKKLDCILLPAGMPPRACLGYSMIQVLYTLMHFGFINNDFEKQIKPAIRLLKNEGKNIQRKARTIAKKLYGKLPIIYSASGFESVATRFRQQLNENSKVLAWESAIPEMNHNELVGWRDKDKNKAVIFLRNNTDYARVQTRMDINKRVIKKYTPTVIDIESQGKSFFEKVFYTVHLTDWVSVYLSEMRGMDTTEVKVIDALKAELAKS